jgi:tetrahydromethanopterin S-methyltransferase subunit A
MLDWIRGLFGRGRIRVEFTGIDRDGKVVTGDGKMPYTGKFTEEDALAEFKQQLMYKHGVVVTQATIVAHLED